MPIIFPRHFIWAGLPSIPIIAMGENIFFSSFELKISFQVVFLTIVNRILYRPSKIPKSRVFPAVSCQPYTFGIWLAMLANSVTEWSNLSSIHWIPPLHILFFNNIQFSIMQISKSISNVNTSACQRWRPGTTGTGPTRNCWKNLTFWHFSWHAKIAS